MRALLLSLAALALAGCEGQTALTIPTTILAPLGSVPVSAEPIIITSSGQTILLNAVRSEEDGNLNSYIELEVLPSALSNVQITRNDTAYGSDVSMEAVASPPKIGLWTTIVGTIGGFFAGAAVAP